MTFQPGTRRVCFARRFAAVVSIAAAVGMAAPAFGQAFTRMINFGDSLTDVGNTQAAVPLGVSPGSDYYNGRYSNGPVWAEGLAGNLHLPAPVNSRSGGLDYAYGGSRSGSGYVLPVSYLPFIKLDNAGTQINSFLASKSFGPDDLVTLWTGANDLLDSSTDPAAIAANVRQHVETLVNAGAKNILVMNMPPLGSTPRYRYSASENSMTARAAQFNTSVDSGLTAVGATHADVNLFKGDVFGFFQQAIASPAAYGFTNVDTAALNENTHAVAAGVDGYLFYDSIHPTRVGHNLIADFAFDRVTARSWATTGNGVWGIASNWAQHRVPDATSAVTLAAGAAFETTLNTPATVRKLTLTTNATLRLAQTTIAVTETPLNLAFGGTLTGRGTVAANLNVTAGTLSPGDFTSAVGQIAVNGTLTQQPAAKLVADFTATDADRIAVTGTAHLGGTLTVRYADGYVGLPGTQRTVMTFTSGDGTFASAINGTAYAGLSFTPIYSPTDVVVRASAIAGDANLDASVNFSDLVVLAQHYNQGGAVDWLAGDFDTNGTVNFTDLVALAQNYNHAPIAGLEASRAFVEDWALAQSLVPEPATLATLMLLPIAAGRRSRRR